MPIPHRAAVSSDLGKGVIGMSIITIEHVIPACAIVKSN